MGGNAPRHSSVSPYCGTFFHALVLRNALGQAHVKHARADADMTDGPCHADAVDFVRSRPGNTAATITPQHILLSRNELFKVCLASTQKTPGRSPHP